MKQLILCVLFFTTYRTSSQDFHFTQSLQNTFLVNPASVGHYTEQSSRLTLLYRSQWDHPGTDKGYQGSAATFEWRHCISNDRHFFALGLTVQRDWSALGALSNTAVIPAAAYHLHLQDDWFMAAGGSVGMLNYSVRESDLQFDAQYANGTFDDNRDNMEAFEKGGRIVSDLSSGFELYNNRKGIAMGFSWLHLNKPKYSFLNDENRLGISFVGHCVATIGINANKTKAITGKFMLRRQSFSGRNSAQWQMLTGVFGKGPVFGNSLQGGVYARWGGVSSNVFSVNAIIPTILFHEKRWELSCSYDINTSGIRTRFSGGMELSAAWSFGVYDKCINCAHW